MRKLATCSQSQRTVQSMVSAHWVVPAACWLNASLKTAITRTWRHPFPCNFLWCRSVATCLLHVVTWSLQVLTVNFYRIVVDMGLKAITHYNSCRRLLSCRWWRRWGDSSCHTEYTWRLCQNCWPPYSSDSSADTLRTTVTQQHLQIHVSSDGQKLTKKLPTKMKRNKT